MDDVSSPRKLASIVAVDVAGYSRRTETDEDATVRAVAILRELIGLSARAHGGRVFNTAGDGFMLEFPTVSGALAAAEQIAGSGDPPVRVGVHVGEVSVTESGDLLGHGVNVAARIQQMASPGAVLVSGEVRRTVRGPLAERLKPQGTVRLDKMSETLAVFALAPAKGGRARGRRFKFTAPFVFGAMAAVVLAAALAAWLGRGLWERSSPREPRVAVLAFDALGQDAGLHDFAVGLQDQILGVMTANQVSTVSRADSQALRGGSSAVERLGVTLLLDGTIERNGESLDVRVHLDDPRRHLTLWSTRLNGSASDTAGLQMQVAADVANVLLCANGLQRSPSAPRDSDTIALFFHACDLSVNLWADPQRPELALAALRQVIARAPGFAQGYARVAYIQASRTRYANDPRLVDPVIPKEASEAARRALQLDPNEGDAWLALSFLQPATAYGAREKLLLNGIRRATTNGSLLRRQAELLAEVGQMREAADYAVRAAASAPLDPEVAGARDAFEAAAGSHSNIADDLRTWPTQPGLWTYSMFIAMWASDWPRAEAALDRPAPTVGRESIAFMRACVSALRSRASAKIAAAEREARANAMQSDPDLHWAIQCLAQLGLTDAAFETAQHYKPLSYGYEGPVVFFYPSTASMRRDLRFMPLMARIGLVDYWRSTGKWPDFCAEPNLPYDCKAEAAKVARAGHG
jgi:adenylate cyclase